MEDAIETADGCIEMLHDLCLGQRDVLTRLVRLVAKYASGPGTFMGPPFQGYEELILGDALCTVARRLSDEGRIDVLSGAVTTETVEALLLPLWEEVQSADASAAVSRQQTKEFEARRDRLVKEVLEAEEPTTVPWLAEVLTSMRQMRQHANDAEKVISSLNGKVNQALKIRNASMIKLSFARSPREQWDAGFYIGKPIYRDVSDTELQTAVAEALSQLKQEAAEIEKRETNRSLRNELSLELSELTRQRDVAIEHANDTSQVAALDAAIQVLREKLTEARAQNNRRTIEEQRYRELRHEEEEKARAAARAAKRQRHLDDTTVVEMGKCSARKAAEIEKRETNRSLRNELSLELSELTRQRDVAIEHANDTSQVAALDAAIQVLREKLTEARAQNNRRTIEEQRYRELRHEEEEKARAAARAAKRQRHLDDTTVVEMGKCSACGRELRLHEFSKSQRGKGSRRRCAPCLSSL